MFTIDFVPWNVQEYMIIMESFLESFICFIYMNVLPACVCVCTIYIPSEVRRECWLSYNRNYSRLLVSMCVLETEPMSSEGTSSLNQ